MSPEPLTDEHEHLRRGLEVANIPTLLMVLTQLTGDFNWLEEPYLPTLTRGLDDHDSGDLPEDRQTEVRAAAFEAITDWLAGAPPAIEVPEEALLLRMMSVCMGEDIPERYAAMLHADLIDVLEAASPDVPSPSAVATMQVGEVSSSDGVILVGAGISGMLAAIKLRELGIPFVLIEKNQSVGGTWLTNVYPGAGVDTPSHLYSAVCAPGDWHHYFAKQNEIQDYLEAIADRFDLRRHIQFGTEVTGAEYDEATQSWHVDTQRADGTRARQESKYLITAVGGFGRPVIPNIPGMQQFEGTLAHTARWPSDLSVAGKRVVVIGTGASGIQLVPALAAQGAEVTVIQRTAQWIAPFEKFNQLVPPDLRHLMQMVPLYRAWYRLRLLWTFSDKIHPALQKDPNWPHPERAVNEINDGHRRFFTRYMQQRLAGRPDLIEKSTPTYPPFGKRILLDNGWYEALLRPNVHLETTGVRELDQTGVVLDDGRHLDADIVVSATGFDVVRFLAPMKVIGREGRELRDEWNDDDARAYLGTAVPGFPNFFTLYGPNTQGAGGSFFFIVECQLNYLMDLLRKVHERDATAVEPRRDVFERYNSLVDEANERMIFTHPGMDTYYRNSRGRVVVVNPFPVVEFWHMTREADLADFELSNAERAVDAGV